MIERNSEVKISVEEDKCVSVLKWLRNVINKLNGHVIVEFVLPSW